MDYETQDNDIRTIKDLINLNFAEPLYNFKTYLSKVSLSNNKLTKNINDIPLIPFSIKLLNIVNLTSTIYTDIFANVSIYLKLRLNYFMEMRY